METFLPRKVFHMPTLPAELLQLIVSFAPLFTKPTWKNAKVLLLGALLATGKRTVTACLRAVGLGQEKCFQNYHRVLNRARWNALETSRILLGLIVALLPAGSTLVIAGDDTIERRRGEKIPGKGCYRDPVRSSHKYLVKCYGLKWLSCALLVCLPWSNRVWALPFLTVLCRGEEKGSTRRHKTAIDRMMTCARLIARWLPDRAIVLVVDGAYAAVKLALACTYVPTKNLTLVTRLRLDVNLYQLPGELPAGKRGRRPQKGKRQRKLEAWSRRSDTPWEEIEVDWYGGERKKLWVFSRVGLWHVRQLPPVMIRYVLVRDPEGKFRDTAFACTKIDVTPVQIIEWFVRRWGIEVTFEEMRGQLGFETQRHWSNLAINRTTPVLLGLFSLIVLLASHLAVDGKIPLNRAAWYVKTEATFSDCLAMVRRHCWQPLYLTRSTENEDLLLIPRKVINHIVTCLALAA
jgi:DDE superfamily endonuclease